MLDECEQGGPMLDECEQGGPMLDGCEQGGVMLDGCEQGGLMLDECEQGGPMLLERIQDVYISQCIVLSGKHWILFIIRSITPSTPSDHLVWFSSFRQ